ncbi:hypothetical protein C8F04DRAFT_1181927 [Mycena alexandri]|uniref:Bacteriophage T5 Orf172 DNA-binding domain-containing protein n=1 Tax=Mycena alexandri TaxID=1745969 RepID=A0AAD6T141_9AGAR|nr:hypothetical protein C8F04DRAFT_1181927 [Mycena alexandri]
MEWRWWSKFEDGPWTRSLTWMDGWMDGPLNRIQRGGRREVEMDLDQSIIEQPSNASRQLGYKHDHTKPALTTLSHSSSTHPGIMHPYRRRQREQPGATELRRRRQLAAITRIPHPIDQCMAHLAKRRYRDFRAELYTVFRITRVFDHALQMQVDALDIKSGYSIDTARRQLQYRDKCRGLEFIWCYKYTCDEVKLLEHLVHLTLRAHGASIPSYPCPGCGVRHREFYLDSAAGGLDGLCGIIEFWLGVLGQPVERVVIQPID